MEDAMRIPKFIKALCKFCDTDPSRYALGGVKCEHSGGVSAMTATDGRYLASVSYADDSDGDLDVIVNGKQLAKAVSAVGTGASSKLSEHLYADDTDKSATIKGDGIASAELCDGRFPRYRDVFPDVNNDDYARATLDPAMLKTIAELYIAATAKQKGKGVRVWVPKDSTGALLFSYVTDKNEIVRTVLMPMAHAEGDYPGEACPQSTQPEPEAVDDNATPLPDVEDDEAYDGEDDEAGGPLDEQPAPPPECVDDDTLAPTFAEPASSLPPPAPLPAGW
jgi:hypothetical protein